MTKNYNYVIAENCAELPLITRCLAKDFGEDISALRKNALTYLSDLSNNSKDPKIIAGHEDFVDRMIASQDSGELIYARKLKLVGQIYDFS